MAITVTRDHLKRGALAKQSGCNLETIRYYENIGIMPEPMRTQSGHRIYDQKQQERLRFILRCRELGFSIGELRRLLSMVDSDGYTCGEVHELTQEYLRSVSEKIADLRKLERTLKTISKECAGGDAPDCPIIEALYE
ncbi:MAG: transcriptional regulator [Robiginitomaculum sp.]|nr:MAG: transcriptional regulator [Robiginitomaculum sp.]